MSVSTITAQELDKKINEPLPPEPKPEPEPEPEPEPTIKNEDLSPKVQEKLEKKYWKEQNTKRKDPEQVEVIPSDSIVKEQGFSLATILSVVALGLAGLGAFKIWQNYAKNNDNQESKGTDSANIAGTDSNNDIWDYLQGKPQ